MLLLTGATHRRFAGGVELDQRVDGGAQGRGGCKQKNVNKLFSVSVFGLSIGVQLDQWVDGGA